MPPILIPGPQVQPEGLPNVRVSADAPLEAFGGGQSAANLTAANEQMTTHAQQYAYEQQSKANQLATQIADRQAADLETSLQTKVMQMRGKDAFGAPDFASDQWDKGTQKINDGLANDEQRMAFQRMSNARWESLNKFTQLHMAKESQDLDTSETNGYIQSSRNVAVLNAFDDQRLQDELSRQKAVYQDYAARNGLSGTDTEKEKLAEIASGTYRDVIQARLTNGMDDKARELFDASKGAMTAQDQLSVESALRQSDLLEKGNDAWDQVSGMKLANGEPDEARMRSAVFSMDLSPADKEHVWDFVKARSGEEISNKAREDQARERGFLNQVLKGKQQGADLTSAIKLAQNTGIDTYEQNIFADAAKKIYAPPDVTSDKSAYMNLWERVRNGDAAKQDIDQAWNQGKLSTSDWESLRKDWYNQKTSPTSDPAIKDAWDRVNALADQNFTNKKDREEFLYIQHQKYRDTDGVAPEEIIKGAQDSLKTVGQHPWFGVSFLPSWNTGETGWKADLKKTDAANLAWGQAYQDLGKDAVDAFREGVEFQSKRAASPADLNAFAERYGGYQNLKPGTPVYNAILSIQKAGRPVVPENIDWVLKKYPDGQMR